MRWRSLVWGVFLFAGPQGLFGDITPDNFFDLLEIGEVSYSISVSVEKIDWSNGRGKPKEEPASVDLADLRKRHKTRGDEESARDYARAAQRDGETGESDAAYLALLPFLESGRAAISTVYCAIDNRTASQDFALARQLGEVYRQVYPLDAELCYQMFNASLAGSIYNRVFYLLNTTLDVFLEQRDESLLTERNIEAFFESYLRDLHREIDVASLERAVELDPDNYKYNLTAGFVKTLIVFLSKVGTAAVARDVEEDMILEILADKTGAGGILCFLESANRQRPQRDIQIYLAYAMFHATFAEAGPAVKYARKAVRTRPDLPEGYDALLYTLMFSDVLEHDELTDFDSLIAVLESKLENVGKNNYDYYSLSVLTLVRQTDNGDNPLPKTLARMKRYLDQARKLDSESFFARFGLANYYLLFGDYGRAIGLYEELAAGADRDRLVMVYNNQGLALVLNGDRGGALEALERALGIDEQNRRTKRALAALQEP